VSKGNILTYEGEGRIKQQKVLKLRSPEPNFNNLTRYWVVCDHIRGEAQIHAMMWVLPPSEKAAFATIPVIR
jgi:hypothetical protein